MLDEKYSSYKNLAYLFIAILLVVGFYQLFVSLKSKPGIKENEVTSGAYFVPKSENAQEEKMSGIIKKIPELEASNYSYGLYDEKGNLLAYLSSSKIDFSLSSGLNVEINGKRNIRNLNGYAIMDVKSVRLK